MPAPIRVAQWATGAIGRTCLRAVLDAPEFELVGLLVYSDDKAGLDAGDIARRPRTGVRATTEVAELLETPADVVIHTPRIQVPYSRHDDDICRLLRSGKNVITTAGHHYPAAHGPEREHMFRDAAEAGGATLFGTGVSPGVIGERITLALTSAVLDLDAVSITEVVDTRGMRAPDFVFDVMGMGRRPEDFVSAAFGAETEHQLAALYRDLFSETLAFIADELGIADYRLVADHEVLAALTDLDVAAGPIAAGTVASTCWRWHVVAGGRRLVTLAINWTMEPDRPEYRDAPHWRIRISGRPNIDVAIDIDVTPDPSRATYAGQFMTVGPVIQAIPEVVAAPPGILRVGTFTTRRRGSDLARRTVTTNQED